MIDRARNKQQILEWIYVVVTVLAIIFLCLILPKILYETDYDIDYNIVGILIPVVCYFTPNKKSRIAIFAVGLIALSVFYGGVQWFCLLSLPLIAMYNYKRGKLKLKNLFYFYYPAHLCVIFVIGGLL